MNASDIIRVGIIGCGGIANGKHMPSLKKVPGVQMVAFCDIVVERAEKAAAQYGVPGAKVYEDYKKATGDETPTVIASTASAYKFAESVAKSIGLGDEENGFRYVDALAAKTGVRIPKGLQGLETKEIRHTGVIDVDQMMATVEAAVK